MEEIKLLVERIEDELDDACAYAKLALEYKTDDPDLATLFYRLSGEEMTHMELLHKQAVRLIDECKREKGEAPAAMTAVYNFMHDRFTDRAEKVERLQGMFKR